MTKGEESLDASDIGDAYARSVRQVAGEKPWHAIPVHDVEAILAEQSGQGLFGDVGGAFRCQCNAVPDEAARTMAMVATKILHASAMPFADFEERSKPR